MKHDLPVSRFRPVRTFRTLSLALTLLALAGAGAVAATPAQAVTREAAAAPCITTAARATKWREATDTSEVSPAVRADVERVVHAVTGGWADRSSARTAALPAHVRVPVYIHVIHGHRRGEHRINRRKAHRMFRILKGGFAGSQDPTMTPTGVNFRLKRITITRNERWFHAEPLSHADKQMKKRLHRGRANALNIYVNRPRVPGGLLLGFSTFPWQRAWRSKLDSVVVNERGLPGGSARGYNLGDTVVHETGHWMGLLHPFEGGCADGDGVADTAPEALPSFKCDERNSCTDGENPLDPTTVTMDPIHNFMDYSYDYCMNQFTPGQRARMIALFVHYRARH